MPLFPLDSLRNATISYELEPYLEDVRESIIRFPFNEERDGGNTSDMIDVFDVARPRFNVLAALLQPVAGSRCADISTGLGFLPVLLARMGLSVTATERDPRIARFASEHGIPVLPYHLGRDDPPIAPASLDALVFAEVLEHLKLSPIPVLTQVAGLLRPGGLFLLTTPNIARLAHVEMLAAGENFLEPFLEDLPIGEDATDYLEHVREYSVRETVEAVEAAGIGIDEVLMTGWGEAGYHPLANPWVNEIIVVVGRI